VRAVAGTCALASLWACVVGFAAEEKRSVELSPDLRKYVDQRVDEFDQIPADRRAQLEKIADYVKSQVKSTQPIKLTFICTHNSRRSHMSQIWAAIAAQYYGVARVETFSGGTEATAFNPRAVAALKRAGLKVEKKDDEANPRYEVSSGGSAAPLICFSKVYNESPNPESGFCAVMTCTQADQKCPLVKGSTLRVSLPFDDPKVADNTPDEASKYDERCSQISREMLYLFSRVGQ